MIFTREQKQVGYKKLPTEIQEFVMAEETTNIIANHLKNIGLTEDQSNQADSEILYAMLGLQSLQNAIVNISKLSNKNIESLYPLRTNLENQIFSKIHSSQNIATSQPEKLYSEVQNSVQEPRKERQSNVGSSFEQTMMNQVRAMQPAVAASSQQSVASSKVPNNLSTEEKPRIVHNYSADNDPYREPLE